MPQDVKIPKLIGDWKVIEFLGNGGMGMVVLATHQNTGKQAAIKVMMPDALSSESALKRFKKEINALRNINSPHVAALLDYSDDRSFPWYALEFVSDFSLRDTMKMHGKFSDQAWWDLAKGILKAVEAIHSAGVIHRDLKPDNIMMSKKGPKIIDFGLAKSFSSISSMTETRRDVVMGTLAYMPPEQHKGILQTTEKSDVYSVGITLVEAAGMRLEEIWRGGTEAEIIANKFQSSPNISKLSKSQQKFIEKMIKKTAEDRLSAKQLLKIIDKSSQEVNKELAPRKNNKPGFITKLDNWADRMGAYAEKKEAQAKDKKVARAQARNQEIGIPAQVQSKTKKEFEPLFADQEFPVASRLDRLAAYFIDFAFFTLSLGIIQIWFYYQSRGQLSGGRKFRRLLIIDSKTKKPVSGKRALLRGLVLNYLLFTIVPFSLTNSTYPWLIFVSPILISMMIFLPSKRNPWDFLTNTTVGKYENSAN